MNLGLLVIVILIYLFAVAYLGYLGYRQTRNAQDYLLAGRSIPSVVMVLSYGATLVSTSAIVGFGGVAGLFGMGLLWLVLLNIVVGIFIAFIFFGKRTRRMGVVLDAETFPELLGKRFQSRGIQGFVGVAIFLAMPLYAAVVLIGGGRFIETILGINYDVALLVFTLIISSYVIAGGLKGVMYTDALQGGIMFVGMLFLLVMTYAKLGGPTAAHEQLLAMVDLVPEDIRQQGHRGWTAMPSAFSPWWWTLVSTLVMGVGVGVLGVPQLVVRFMTVKSDKALNQGVIIGAVFILVIVGGAFVVGTLSNAFFYQGQGQIAITAAGGNPDSIIPLYINQAMPVWFSYLFMITLLAAAMSTLSSQFHVMGTAIGRDFFQEIISDSRASLNIVRLGVLVSIIVSVILGYMLPPGIIARGTAVFFGLCASGFLPVYAAALYWKGVTRAGAYWSIGVGLGASLFCLAFLHREEAAALGLSQFLFGKEVLVEAHPWPVIDPILIALPFSALTLVLVSLFTHKLPAAHLDKCFAPIQRTRPGPG